MQDARSGLPEAKRSQEEKSSIKIKEKEEKQEGEFVGVGKWWGKQRVRDYLALRLLLIFLPGDDA